VDVNQHLWVTTLIFKAKLDISLVIKGIIPTNLDEEYAESALLAIFPTLQEVTDVT